MGRRRTVITTSSSSDEENDSSLVSKPSGSARSRTARPVKRPNPRFPKKPRLSGPPSTLASLQSDKVDTMTLFCEDFGESFLGFNSFNHGYGKGSMKELWVDKHRPHSTEALAVIKKVEEVKVWIEERLKLPRGKNFNQVLIIKLGLENLQLSRLLHLILVSHCGNGVHLLLQFGKSMYITQIQLLVQSTNVPTVILITDCGKVDSVDNSCVRYIEELQLSLESAGACKVSLNPITTNSIKKKLSRICALERFNVNAEQIDLKAKASGGDIRHAILSLQYFCLRPDLKHPVSVSNSTMVDLRKKPDGSWK